MVACVVITSTELTFDLLSANCGEVSKALAGIVTGATVERRGCE